MIDQLVYCVNSYREAAMSSDVKFDHIDMAEKQKVISYSLVWIQGDYRKISFARKACFLIISFMMLLGSK